MSEHRDDRVKKRLSRVLLSTSRDAAVNLAAEESLLAAVSPGEEILFLCINEPAVVIGRFQVPWKECRTGLARRRGAAVRRRISGGGTVVHGPGNLNFSVISGERTPDKAGNLDRVIEALSDLGVALERNDRFDLVLPRDGRRFKLSGSAFRQTAAGSLHHATLLVEADLPALRELLRVPPRDLRTRGVASRPSPVANLSDAVPGVSTGAAARALARRFGAPAGPQAFDPERDGADPVFREALSRLESPEWIWGRTPAFTERFRDLEGLGTTVVSIEVREGRIASADPPADLLVGSAYHGPELRERLSGEPPSWLEDLARRVDGDAPGFPCPPDGGDVG